MKTEIKRKTNLYPRNYVTPKQRHVHRLLVYYDGSYTGLEGLKNALAHRDADTEIIAVYCIQFPTALSLETIPQQVHTRAEMILAAAEANAKTLNARIETQIICGHDLRAALLAYAADCNAESIFIGSELVNLTALDPLSHRAA